MIDRTAFLRGVLGRPYDRRRRNCWHLAALAQRKLFGVTLPWAHPDLVQCRRRRAEAIAAHPERGSWHAGPPVDGALVLMTCNRLDDIHAGTYLADGGGLVLHTEAPHGAVLDTPLELSAIRGWQLAYYTRLPASVPHAGRRRP